MTRNERRNRPAGPKVWIFVAGSCLRNPGGYGGWGAVVADKTAKTVRKLSGGLRAGDGMTNIRAEMRGVVEALKALPVDGYNVTLWTNADHIAKAMTHGFKRAKNLDIWAEIDAQAKRHAVKWRADCVFNKHRETLEAHDIAQKAALAAQWEFEHKEKTNAESK